MSEAARPFTFWVETLGCPKNQVDSDKLTATLRVDGGREARDAGEADLVVVNTCAFVEEARTESVETVLGLRDTLRDDAKLVVTGCMAERYGDELADALPEVDLVAGFGRPVDGGLGRSSTRRGIPVTAAELPSFDLLNLPRPKSSRPWAYVKVAEGCDRACGFCAIPSFRGKQRSRTIESILAEVDQLAAAEIVLVAQDLAAYGRDQGVGERAIVPLVRAVGERAEWVRLLYLYPSDLTDGLVDAVCESGVPYFDLSLQHVSPSLLRGMRRWGDGPRFLRRIAEIRRREPTAAFRSNFIVGYPGETEADHDQLLAFIDEAELDWCGFFPFSPEEGTHALTLDHPVDRGLIDERLAELSERQDQLTAQRRDALIGQTVRVLVDEPGRARSHREAPEIDGIIAVPESLTVGAFHRVRIVGAAGPDLEAEREAAAA